VSDCEDVVCRGIFKKTISVVVCIYEFIGRGMFRGGGIRDSPASNTIALIKHKML